MDRRSCQACITFFSTSISSMLHHLIQVHRDDPGLNITCEAYGCQCSFVKINSYKSHLYRKHKDIMLTPIPQVQEDIGPMLPDLEGDIGGQNDLDVVEFNRRANAFYLLRTKEVNLLTQKCIDDIAESSTQLVQNTVDNIKKHVQECLSNVSIELDSVPGLEEVFAPNSYLNNPFEHVATKHKQVNFFKDNFGLIPPQRITLGHASVKRRSGITYKEILKPDEMMYIPLLESLENMLNNDAILTAVKVGHQRDDDLLEDICDAQLFKTHPLFSEDPTALQILLYYDEVEIANPLGTKAGKHKLGVVYFTLGNIPPKQRSQLTAIRLLAIATYPVIKNYGIDELLQPIMADLEDLEKDGGHQFKVNGHNVSFAGTIAFVSGDNLGSQLVGGFKEGSGAHLKCRQCMGDTNMVKTMFHPNNFTLRTKAGHDHQCEQVAVDPQLGKTYGVKRRSILCNSIYFHVVDGLPGDAMHDILEGVLQYECKEMLKVFIDCQKYLTLEKLNDRIRTADYGYYNDKNKPSPIARQTLKSETNSLKQKAAQMWCLGKFMPLIIGSIVPTDDEYWLHFLTLLEIVDMVFSPIISIDDLGVLEGLIEEYLWNFTVIYPGKSVIPKMHCLIHYPAHIHRFGPMVRTWCTRYEAKHRFFKRLAGFMGNFTNVAFTLAERHQAQMCYEASSSAPYLLKNTSVGCGKKQLLGDAEYFTALKEQQEDLSLTDKVYEPKKVCNHGTEYRVGAVIQVGSVDGQPEFGIIDKIVVLPSNDTHFILKTLITVEFSQHFHAFEVQKCAEEATTYVLSQKDFKMYLPMHLVKASNTINAVFYVVLRYCQNNRM